MVSRRKSMARSKSRAKRRRASSAAKAKRKTKVPARRTSSAKTSKRKRRPTLTSSRKRSTKRGSKTPKKRNRRASSARKSTKKPKRPAQKKRRQSNVHTSKRAPKRRKVSRKTLKTPKPNPKTPAKKRRKRRQSRTGADTRRLKPRKNRVKTSGPVEINSYTYDVLYRQFLDEFLPKLSKENGVKVDKRSCRVMPNIFDPPTLAEEQYEVQPSPTMLKKAQDAVLVEIDRQEKQSNRGKRTGRRSGMERMFYLATGEEELFVDYDMMRKLVKQAKLYRFTGDDRHDMGYMDPNINRIKINSGHRMTMYDIKVTLMHESMHNTIKRAGRPGNPEISEATEHLAMALCGDPDEFTVLLAEPKLDDFDSDEEFGVYEGDFPWDEDESEECGEDVSSEFELLMTDEKYYQKYLQHIQKLGFELDDIPDICSPDCKKDLSQHEHRMRSYDSPAKCRLALYTPEGSPEPPALVRSNTF